jgi:hypothetical protein
MKSIINHVVSASKKTHQHLKKHGHKYVLWAWALFAMKWVFSLMLGLSFFSFHTNANFETSICEWVTEIPVSECEALLGIYNDTNWDSWTNTGNRWNTGMICDSWYWVSCRSEHVQDLNLSNNNLLWSISVSWFVWLTELRLSDNQLTEIKLSWLPQLQYLTLNDNFLKTIDLWWLTNIGQLYIQNNILRDINLWWLTILQTLIIYNNQLTELDFSWLDNFWEWNISYNNLQI